LNDRFGSGWKPISPSIGWSDEERREDSDVEMNLTLSTPARTIGRG
jgi:hypothetical protein